MTTNRTEETAMATETTTTDSSPRIVRTEYVTIGEDLEVTLHRFDDGAVVLGFGRSGGINGVTMGVNFHLTTPSMLDFADAIRRVVGDDAAAAGKPCAACGGGEDDSCHYLNGEGDFGPGGHDFQDAPASAPKDQP